MGGTINDAADRRVCERIGLRRPVALAAADGSISEGMLVNVSLGGVLVALTGSPCGFAPGEAIELRLSRENGSLACVYACVVVRAGDGLLGLSIDRNSAAKFALEVTRGMFAGKPEAGAA